MNKAKQAIILITVLISFIPSISYANKLRVVRVIDGDTIKVVADQMEIIVRLVGIDAPETSHKKYELGQPFSQKSTKYLAGLVLNKSVEIKSYGTDIYGRTLAVVFVAGKNVNLEMIKAGLAEVYRGPPAKGLDLKQYWKAEEETRDVKRGMWILGDKYISPREWRRGRRN